jgi:hypothetical protein
MVMLEMHHRVTVGSSEEEERGERTLKLDFCYGLVVWHFVIQARVKLATLLMRYVTVRWRSRTWSDLQFGHAAIFGHKHGAVRAPGKRVDCVLGLKTRHKRTSPLLGRFSRLVSRVKSLADCCWQGLPKCWV